MCGITGWIDWENRLDAPDKKERLAKMVATLANRGPDDSGVFVRPCVALGHRRLSVMDPANGAQPMVRRRGEALFAITYNGEIYNAPELRAELEAQGYRFETNCDTEVVLAAYMAYGEACVEKFNGIFALGVWDEAKRRLFLARDRIGVKPLFYAERGREFLFGSEVKTLLANPLVRPEIDLEGFAEVLMIGPARTPGCGIFRGVKELKPGHALVCTEGGGAREYAYWQLESLSLIHICYVLRPVKFQRIRRITGYLVGTVDRWNDAKRCEEADRVKHSCCGGT